jgi:hypothetical protein
MDNVTAIRKEMERVRALKRALECEVELLRVDAEKGKIHLRVNKDEDFRKKLAIAIVDEAHPGYHGDGWHYCDPVEGKIIYRSNGSLSPWSDSVNWRVVSIHELLDTKQNDFSAEVDWNVADIPYRDMVAAYLESEDEEFEENGDIPKWVDCLDVIDFAETTSVKWATLIENERQNALDAAINFAIGEIKDEILVVIRE